MKHMVALLFLSLVCTATYAAQQPAPQVKVVPLKPVPAASGKQMYVSYCAACHGLDAKGNGPAAPALKAPPTDLTTIARNNGGKFPETHIYAVLQFGEENAAHGSKDMPVWGSTLGAARGAFAETQGEVQLRLANLVKYIKMIQQ